MLVNLSAYENPYLHKGMEFENLNRYVEYKEVEPIIEKISKYVGCNNERIILANGTDKLIEKVILNFHKNRDLVVLNPNGYRFIDFAKKIGMKTKRIQLLPPNFNINWEKKNIKNSIIVIDYPNNPTGQFLISEEELENLLKKNNIVIVDEAAFEYACKTFSNLVEKYDNICVTRTFDKAFGMAGLKVGYMIASQNISDNINRSIEINRPTLQLISNALEDKKYLEEAVTNNFDERQRMTDELTKLGIKVFESYGNYLLIHSEIPDFALKLYDKDIIIRDLSYTWLKGYYSISIGSVEENNGLLKGITEL